jgi:hypothetical protein
LRQQPFVQQWLKARGKVDTGKGIQLNDRDRDAFTAMLRQNGVQVPDGMKVDGAGNFNQKNHLWRNVGIGAAIGGAALTGLGTAGIGPLAGAMGGASAAGGAATGATTMIPGTGIPVVAGTGAATVAPTAAAGSGSRQRRSVQPTQTARSQ